jgi:hypothetical protein
LIDKQFLFVIVTRHHKLSGRNSVVECHLAKVDVDGSNPFARSIFFSERRHSQVAKAAVCKTVIPRFKSGCRLQISKGAAIFGLPLFFMTILRCAWIDPAAEITFRTPPFPGKTVINLKPKPLRGGGNEDSSQKRQPGGT